MHRLKTNQLPKVLTSEGWIWESLDKIDNFWVGKDTYGNRWLLKGRGSFNALREKSFSYFSQRLGINTQSSTYLILSDEHELYLPKVSKYQLAIEYLCEHEDQEKDCIDCPIDRYRKIFETTDSKIVALLNSELEDAIDWVKVDMLAYICGANEPSDRLITKDHRIFTIDNEQMFSTEPVELITCDWFNEDYEEAMKVAIELCEKIVDITDKEILSFTSIPENYHIKEHWSIKKIMFSAREYATKFLSAHK